MSCQCSYNRLRRPEKIGAIIGRLIKKIDKDRIDIQEVWLKTVEPKLSRHTRPISLRRGVLTINVENPGWLYILSINKESLLTKIRRLAPAVMINDIRFRIGDI